MLTQIQIQRYKSLFDVTVDLEPLTVFIGPNGSGKSNMLEALKVLSFFAQGQNSLTQIFPHKGIKVWQGQPLPITIRYVLENLTSNSINIQNNTVIRSRFEEPEADWNVSTKPFLQRMKFYDFSPFEIAQTAVGFFTSSGKGIANLLADMLLDHRERFEELEGVFKQLVPNIARISLNKTEQGFELRLVDRYSKDHRIPAADISDGTLRILAFLTAVYQADTPSMICFEEPENGIHPWLLHKMMEILQKIAKEGIGGQPVQVLITTHSPTLLNYVEPKQVRVVELDKEGKTLIHPLPLEDKSLQNAMEAYENQIGELWFTNVIGGNPK